MSKSIGVLGAGAFGTALAIAYGDMFDVTLFSCFENHVLDMRNSRINEFFPSVRIPDNINIDIAKNLGNYQFDYIFWVFPISPTAEILSELQQYLNSRDIIICSKGLLPDSSFTTTLFKDKLPDSKIAYLAGPNFAIDLGNKKFSAANITAHDINYAIQIANDLSIRTFKLRPIDDLIGAQICGAMKNIMAIGSGIVKGLNLGENAYAAYLNLALKEMERLAVCLGAKKETIYDLCGLGDLILTTSSKESRNTSLGFNIAQGTNVQELVKNNNLTCEGYYTLKQILTLSFDANINLPICQAINKILFESSPADSILDVFE